jgi:hypothetical protein
VSHYKIIIHASKNGKYKANSLKEAEQIAEEECNDIYVRLNGRYKVEVESIEEINE